MGPTVSPADSSSRTPGVRPGASVRRASAMSPAWPDRLRAAAPYLAAVLSSLWVVRPFFSGDMLGDLGDARWTISLHEHWFRVWTGEEGVRDLLNYSPMTGTLGTSDGFLVQGQFYAAARMLGVGLAGSWAVASTVYFVLGALGVAAVSTRLLRSTTGRVAFVVLTCTSYSVAANIGMHIQLIGVLVSSWVLLAVLDLAAGRALRRSVLMLAVVPPVLALSTWYAMILLGFYLVALAIALLLLTPSVTLRTVPFQRLRDVSRVLGTPVGIAALVLAAAGWAAVLWVYLPARGLFPDPSYLEVMLYSPQWSDLINASSSGGGIWGGWYESLYGGPTVDETARGFTPVVGLAFLAVLLFTLRRAVLRPVESHRETQFADADRASDPTIGFPGRIGMLAAGLAALAVVALIIVDGRGLGLYRVLWMTVPGMESIRTPFRIMDIVYGAAFFVVVRGWERWWRRSPGRRGLIAGVGVLLVAAFLVEMYRPPISLWRAEQLLPTGLAAQVGPAQERCDAVVVVQPSATGSAVLAGADAVMFAVVADLPTPQGYSRGNPIGYPEEVGDGWPFVNWMRQQGYEGTICRVSDAGVEPFPAAS